MKRRKEYSLTMNAMINAGLDGLPDDRTEALNALFDLAFEAGKGYGIDLANERFKLELEIAAIPADPAIH